MQWVPGDIYPGINSLGREADRSLPSNADDKKKFDLLTGLILLTA
jgi:hypothetical protein